MDDDYDTLVKDAISKRFIVINVILYSSTMLFGGGPFMFNDLCLGELSFECEEPQDVFYHNNNTCKPYKILNGSVHFLECKKYSFSTGKTFKTSAVSRFQIVCEGSYRKELDLFAFLVGGFSSFFITSFFLDNFGRKRVVVVSLALLVMAEIVQLTIELYPIFFMTRLAEGLLTAGIYHASFTLCNELVPPEVRNIVGVTIYGFFGLSILVATMVSWFTREWVTYVLVETVGNIIPLVLILIFGSESPRWLYLHKMDKFNKFISNTNTSTIKRDEKQSANLNIHEKDIAEQHKSQKKYSNFLDIFQHRLVLFHTTILIIISISCSLLYYGVLFGASLFQTNVHLYLAFIGSVETPMSLIYLVFSTLLSRKLVHFISFFIGGISCVAAALLPKNDAWSILVYFAVICGKMTSSFAMINTYLWSSELFPTSHRAIGVGLVIGMGRLSICTIPGFRLLSAYLWSPLAALLIGCLGIAVSFLCCVLRETKNTPLLETLHECGTKSSNEIVKNPSTSDV